MKAFFKLQLVLANRRLVDWGINPLLAYLIAGVAFVLLSNYIFLKTEFAPYLLALLAYSWMLKAADIRRLEFLRTVFGDYKARVIRNTENIAISLPFLVLYCYEDLFLVSAIFFIGSICLANVSIKILNQLVMPTPFSKNPFEFTIGFRQSYLLFPVAYTLLGVAIWVDNFNLGLFAMLLFFLTVITFYTKPENEYFVWSYSTSPSKFLVQKIFMAFKYTAFLALPSAALLCAFYPDKFPQVLLFLLLGFAFLWTVILAKYAAYPNEMSLPEGILIAGCLYFPPLLLLLIPYFYARAIKKLNEILI